MSPNVKTFKQENFKCICTCTPTIGKSPTIYAQSVWMALERLTRTVVLETYAMVSNKVLGKCPVCKNLLREIKTQKGT